MTLTLVQKSVAAIAVAGIGLTCLDTHSAQAALLHFSFTTDGDGAGSFVLDTDTPVSPDIAPQIFDRTGQTLLSTGIYYGNAVSNFTFSSPGAGSFAFPTYSNLDFVVFPDFPSPSLPSVAGIGPLECSLTPNCAIQLSFDYSGSVGALPNLSSNPGDYTLTAVVGYPTGEDFTFDELVTSQTVAGVPEPTVIPGVLAAGAIGGFLRKRLQLRQKRA